MINVNNKAVLIVSYDWPPSAEVGAVRVQKIAAYLHREGWTPIILTVKESHYERVFKEQGDGSFRVLRTGCLPSPLKTYPYVKKVFGKLRGQSRRPLTSMDKHDLKVSPVGKTSA